MKEYFYRIADQLKQSLRAGEEYIAYYSGENSDFCRLNDARVRQAGTVTQQILTLRLIEGRKNCEASITLTGNADEDARRLSAALERLRSVNEISSEDPYLMYALEPTSTETISQSQLKPAEEMIEQVIERANDDDLVGIFASGMVARGFANSLGQRNWYQTTNFNFDFSLYLRADKAVKGSYAGSDWDLNVLDTKFEHARQQLRVLEKTPRELKPGRYRAFLAAGALTEVVDLLAWGGFGLKAHKTKTTPLLRMIEEEATLNSQVSMLENTADGVAPNFNRFGYIRPARVPLVTNGRYQDCLVSPRSAQEYNVETNGADSDERPDSFELAAGSLRQTDVLPSLKDGLYINNLWYLNYSDRRMCRITGMTRFAFFWVENGTIVAPVNVMRFDESIYRMFGDRLEALTVEREMLIDPTTYGSRAAYSARVPGILVNDFSLTL